MAIISQDIAAIKEAFRALDHHLDELIKEEGDVSGDEIRAIVKLERVLKNVDYKLDYFRHKNAIARAGAA
jgi:ElaB/YqjD/DUF883 family membrane-anchored ribosome-binding protein